MGCENILITGGAGFIGCNLAHRLLTEGHHVTIFDNLTRSGCVSNLAWLEEEHGSNSFQLIKGDVTNFNSLLKASEGVERVYHLAAQVAVTTSVKNPRQDFEDNALGSFNALEAARQAGNNPIFVFASTNKVYGSMNEIETVERDARYQYVNMPDGISETQPIDFHSPYGCSKGTGDQYTRDYSRIYGMRTVVMRQSCIYGYRQFGVEDQGWVAWFIIAALSGRPITIYGNGKQVRDILFVEDLLDAYEAAVKDISSASGQIFNVGGGPENTLSIWAEFGPLLEKLLGHPIPVTYADWRPGDQPIYISNIHKAKQILGWQPRISVEEGINRLFEWIREKKDLFSS